MIERNIEREVDALKAMYASLFEITESIIEENKNLAQLILDVSEVACGRGRIPSFKSTDVKGDRLTC